MTDKGFLIRVLGGLAASFLLLMAFNYILDPVQYFRKASFHPAHLTSQERYQMPGLAKNYDYDTIIVGTSMTQNFSPAYIDNKLGVKSIKLSLAGSTAKEQNLVANLAIGTGKVKKVIWSIDYGSIVRYEKDQVKEGAGVFPEYLYDKRAFNDLKYLINRDVTLQALGLVACELGLKKGKHTNLEEYEKWSGAFDFSREKILKFWNLKQKNMSAYLDLESEAKQLAKMQANIDHNIYQLVKANPDLEFHFFYPPYSVLLYRAHYEGGQETLYLMREYFFERLGHLENVKIYDFQTDFEVTANLNNYKDFSHYSEKVNEYIIDQIQKDKYRVTADNLGPNLTKLKSFIETLDVKEL